MEQATALMTVIEQASKLGIGIVSAFILIFGAAWMLYQLKPLVENNTRAIEAMSAAMSTFGVVLTKTSDKVIAHDERSVAIAGNVEELMEQVNGLQKDVSELKGRMQVQ